MKRRRVKITGIGPVTPAGVGKEAFWKGILEPVSRVRPFTKLDPELGEFVAAYLDDFDVERYVPRSAVPKGAARHTQFALAGTVLALADAKIDLQSIRSRRSLVCIGASLMDFGGIGRSIAGVLGRGAKGVWGRVVYTANVSSISASVVDALALCGRSMAIQSSCCSGLDAIGSAARAIIDGDVDIAICGGVEAPLYTAPLVELRSVGMTPSTCENAAALDRPFDLWRTTGVVSEGGAVLVLEADNNERPAYGFVDGYAFENDVADDLCGGLAVAVVRALAEAGFGPQDVDLINAWGPGHRMVDAAEVRALSTVFGARLPLIPAVSIKGSVGNALGGAGAIQVAAAALGLRNGAVPPTVNWRHPDPSCALGLSACMRSLDHRLVVVNAHGVSGVNASILLNRS